MLASSGYVLPVPRPATATWTSDDQARLRRALQVLRVSREEAAMLTDGRHASDIPTDEAWRTVTAIAAGIARIEFLVSRLEEKVNALAAAVPGLTAGQ